MNLFSIDTIGVVPVNHAEYRDPTLVNIYLASLQTLQNVLTAGQTPGYQATINDYDTIMAAIQQLSDLAHNGVYSDSTRTTTYINLDMAQDLDSVMRTLQTAGIPPPSDVNLTEAQQIQLVKNWQSLAGFGYNDIFNQAIRLVSAYTVTDPTSGRQIVIDPRETDGRTLQSMIEINYIGTCNQVLATNLTSLQSALHITSSVVGLLTYLQNFANAQLAIPSKSPFVMPQSAIDAGSLVDFKKAYSGAAGNYFSQIFPSVINTPSDAPKKLYDIRLELGKQLLRLPGGQNPATASTGTLANAVYKVVKDISAMYTAIFQRILNLPSAEYPSTVRFNTPSVLYGLNIGLFNQFYSPAVYLWCIDGQNLAAGADPLTVGAIQNNLSQAINNAENLNGSQKDSVKNYLYLYQQFYQSASAILTYVNQTLVSMGKKTRKK